MATYNDMETVSEMFLSQEDVKPHGLQRLWARRSTSGQIIVDDSSVLEEIFLSAQDDDVPLKTSRPCSPNHLGFWDIEDSEDEEHSSSREGNDVLPLMCLDSSYIGNIPVRYVIPSLPNHEFPVTGYFIDPRIVPGFKYKVRILPDMKAPGSETKYLFDGKALTLESIGRGYCHRLTFEPDPGTTLNNNSNYFWSDSRPEGFAFELQVVSVGDKFMVHDANSVVAGELEVTSILVPQEEVSHVVTTDGTIEKTVKLKALCKMEWYEDTGPYVLVAISGVAVCKKHRGDPTAKLSNVVRVTIGKHEHRRGFSLTPGWQSNWRRTNVNGAVANDVPIKYTLTGLKQYELPAVGTYVDPRIIPGFQYKVRPLGSKIGPLFQGRYLRLTSVGIGYGKRITFEPDQDRLNEPDNYFWSDSNPEGYGFELRVVHTGMKFRVEAQGQILGQAQVFRADMPQYEITNQITEKTVTKTVSIEITCHVSLSFDTEDENTDWKAMKVRGRAVVTKYKNEAQAKILKIDNIGLDSQLNLLFVRQHDELVFLPL